MAEPNLDDIKRRMNGAIEVLRTEFSGLRAGRASTGLLDPVMVDAYGSKMPLSQVGTVGVPDPRQLTVQVWDSGLVGVYLDSVLRQQSRNGFEDQVLAACLLHSRFGPFLSEFLDCTEDRPAKIDEAAFSCNQLGRIGICGDVIRITRFRRISGDHDRSG